MWFLGCFLLRKVLEPRPLLCRYVCGCDYLHRDLDGFAVCGFGVLFAYVF